MAYFVCGSDTGTSLAPARPSVSMAARTAASISASMPDWKYSAGMPTRSPRSPSGPAPAATACR